MPRMSKKRRLEWAFFLNERNRITFNALCRGCTHDCKPPQNSAYGNGIPKRSSKTASPAPDTAGTSHDGFRDAPRATMQIRPR